MQINVVLKCTFFVTASDCFCLLSGDRVSKTALTCFLKAAFKGFLTTDDIF